MDEREVEVVPKMDESSPNQASKRATNTERLRKGLFSFKKVESEADTSWFDIFGFGNYNVLNNNMTYGLTLALPQCDCKRLYSRPITFNVEQAGKDRPRFKSLPKQVKGERCKRFHQWWLKCCQSAVLKKQGIYWSLIKLLVSKVKANDQQISVAELVLGKRITLAIELDIKRTYPSLRFFNRYGRSMLRRVLLAYSFFDTEVGYVQGLNFIVANLLWHSSEEQAFWALISMMYLYDLRCMFLPGLPGVFKRCEILEHCMVKHIPRLHNHLKSVGVHIPMIASDWFMTLCANSVPIRALARLWDSFFSEGWVAIFRFVIFRLKQFEEYLVTMSDIADIMKVIKYGDASLAEKWNIIELIPGFGGPSRRKSQLISAAYSTNVDNLTNDPNKIEKDSDWVSIVEESLNFDIESSFIETLELTNSEIMYFDIPRYPSDYDFKSDTLKSCISSENSLSPSEDDEVFRSPLDRSPTVGPIDKYIVTSDDHYDNSGSNSYDDYDDDNKVYSKSEGDVVDDIDASVKLPSGDDVANNMENKEGEEYGDDGGGGKDNNLGNERSDNGNSNTSSGGSDVSGTISGTSTSPNSTIATNNDNKRTNVNKDSNASAVSDTAGDNSHHTPDDRTKYSESSSVSTDSSSNNPREPSDRNPNDSIKMVIGDFGSNVTSVDYKVSGRGHSDSNYSMDVSVSSSSNYKVDNNDKIEINVRESENTGTDKERKRVVDNGDGALIRKTSEIPEFESTMKILRKNSLEYIADKLEELSITFKSQLEAIGVSKAYHLHLKALHDEL